MFTFKASPTFLNVIYDMTKCCVGRITFEVPQISVKDLTCSLC